MNNRFDRESEHSSNERSSTSMMRVLGQMLMLPFTVFVYGMEMFARTMHRAHRVAEEGMDLTAGGTSSLEEETPVEPNVGSGMGIVVNHPADRRAIQLGDAPYGTAIEDAEKASGGDRRARNEIDTSEKAKETKMDKDLRDDMLKLVRYKVLFVKREYEHAFLEQEELVSENMDGTSFTAWKVAEFIQTLGKRSTRVPSKWGKTYPEDYREGDVLTGLPDEDKMYLRIFYEVLDRYPREKFEYEERQIKVLEEIRNKLPSGDS